MKQSVCKNGLFSPSCFMAGREAESTFGIVTRRFAPWRLYTSAECASLLTSLIAENLCVDDDRKVILNLNTYIQYFLFASL